MTSDIWLARSDLALRSPNTQVTASETFDLPQPFGPTMAFSVPVNFTDTGSTNDLNPEISR